MRTTTMPSALLCSFCLVACLSGFLFSSGKLFAQERQAAFDPEGKFLTIGPEQERKLRLFPEYPNFLRARLLQQPDSSYVLEVIHILNDVPQREMIAMDLPKLLALRKRFVLALRKTIPDVEITLADVEKVGTAVGNTALGLGYGFVGLIASAGNSSSLPATSIMMPLIIGGGSIWAVSQPWFNRSSLVMLENGLTVGTVHGLALSGLFSDAQSTKFSDSWVTGVATGVIEAALGVYMAEKLQLNYGQTTLITELGTSGLLTGAGLGFIFSTNLNAVSGAALLGSGAGFAAGYALSQGQSWADGDALVFGALSPIGLMLPTALTLLSRPSDVDPRAIVATSLATHLGSYLVGSWLINNKDFTYYQGSAITGATTIGMLTGLAAFLISPPNVAVQYMLGLSALGGTVGFAISYGQAAARAELQAQTNLLEGASSSTFVVPSIFDELAQNTRVEFSPLGLVGVAYPHLLPVGYSLPILSIRHTFSAPK